MSIGKQENKISTGNLHLRLFFYLQQINLEKTGSNVIIKIISY